MVKFYSGMLHLFAVLFKKLDLHHLCNTGVPQMNAERGQRSLEMSNFYSALRRVMRVSKEDLNKILADEKAANADKPKRGPKPTGKTVTQDH
jgi:hypothetical protein